MEEEGRPHFNIHRKRAAVDVYREAKRFRKEECKDSVSALAIAQVASGGAGRRQIFQHDHARKNYLRKVVYGLC